MVTMHLNSDARKIERKKDKGRTKASHNSTITCLYTFSPCSIIDLGKDRRPAQAHSLWLGQFISYALPKPVHTRLMYGLG